jgi:hypothetical protein
MFASLAEPGDKSMSMNPVEALNRGSRRTSRCKDPEGLRRNGMPGSKPNLLLIECSDETALLDPADERWIDDQIRIGLFRMGYWAETMSNAFLMISTEGVGTASSSALVYW